MKGDFSRFTDDPKKHYSGVLKQQGRVDLDADWNEEVAIRHHLSRTTRKDVIGPCGVPAGSDGFRIGITADKSDLTISAGRIYVDGILCELDTLARYKSQPDFPDPLGHGCPVPQAPTSGSRTDLVYLDVWERNLTVLDDPEIREIALGGVDTTTRVKTVWQVKVETGVPNKSWRPTSSHASLTVTTDEVPDPEDPCLLAPEGGYQGIENRHYRVEIHKGGSIGDATFKWSRDNASVVYGVESAGSSEVRLLEMGKDQILALKVSDWIEILSDDEILHGKPGVLAEVEAVDETTRIVTLAAGHAAIPTGDHLKAIRWDHAGPAMPLPTADAEHLEDGICVQFAGDHFLTGDYWTFAARAGVGLIGEPQGDEPHGIIHHYCPLAQIVWKDDDSDPDIPDERDPFDPLTSQIRLYYVGGTGQDVMPPPGGNAELARPLQVGVTQPGMQVRFETEEGIVSSNAAVESGTDGATEWIVVESDADGIAECNWTLDAAGAQTQQAIATLWEGAGPAEEGNPIPGVIPLRFHGNLSRASDVSFNPTGTGCDSESTTVQEALDELCGKTSQLSQYVLRCISGNGQRGSADSPLSNPLVVRVTDLSGEPISNAEVRFTINVESAASDSPGSLSGIQGSAISLLETSDADGLAEVDWTLGGFLSTSTPQQVLVTLSAVAGGSVDPAPPPVVFFAFEGAQQPLPVDGTGVEDVIPGGPPFLLPVDPPEPPDGMVFANIDYLEEHGVVVEFSEAVNPDSVNRFTFVVTLLVAEGGEIASDVNTSSFSDFHALGSIDVAQDGMSAVFRFSETALHQLRNLHYYCGVPERVGSSPRFLPCRVTLESRHILVAGATTGNPVYIGTHAHEEWFLIAPPGAAWLHIGAKADVQSVAQSGVDVLYKVTLANNSAASVTVTNLEDKHGAIPEFAPVALAPGESEEYVVSRPVSGNPDTLDTNTVTANAVDPQGNQIAETAIADVRIEPEPPDRIYIIPNLYHNALLNASELPDPVQQDQLLQGLSLGLDRAALQDQLSGFAFYSVPQQSAEANQLLTAVIAGRQTPWALACATELEPVAVQLKALLDAANPEDMPVYIETSDDENLVTQLERAQVTGLAILSDRSLRAKSKASIDELIADLVALGLLQYERNQMI